MRQRFHAAAGIVEHQHDLTVTSVLFRPAGETVDTRKLALHCCLCGVMDHHALRRVHRVLPGSKREYASRFFKPACRRARMLRG